MDQRTRIPLDGLVFGYGPMLPLVAAGVGAWLLPAPWPALAVRLAIIWGGLLLAFLAGVRRGYGFGNVRASTRAEILTMLVYFILAGLALVAPDAVSALSALILGVALVALLDRRAARHGDVPAYFARLRGPQMLVGLAGLLLLFVHVAR